MIAQFYIDSWLIRDQIFIHGEIRLQNFWNLSFKCSIWKVKWWHRALSWCDELIADCIRWETQLYEVMFCIQRVIHFRVSNHQATWKILRSVNFVGEERKIQWNQKIESTDSRKKAWFYSCLRWVFRNYKTNYEIFTRDMKVHQNTYIRPFYILTSATSITNRFLPE